MLDMILYLFLEVLYAKGGSDDIAFADLLFNKRVEQNPEKNTDTVSLLNDQKH